MKFKNFQIQIGKKQENPENGTDEDSDVMVNQIASLEEQVNGKTRELEETEQQLKELSGTVQEAEEESPPQPHGPIGELTVEPRRTQDTRDGQPGGSLITSLLLPALAGSSHTRFPGSAGVDTNRRGCA